MVSTPAPSPKCRIAAPRKRKAHNKSRSGCGNCKLRRVKCDESKPGCKKCIQFGISCNYGSTESVSTGEMIISLGSTSPPIEVVEPSKAPVSMTQTMLDLINYSLRESPTGRAQGSQVFQLRKNDLEILGRFTDRSILTVGTDTIKYLFQAEAARLACLHPFLMHMVLAFTIMHDRAIEAASKSSKQTQAELYHFYHGISLFNSKMFTTATSSELDALWIASILIGSTGVALIDADSAEEAWPLKDPEPGDPDWIALTMGKNEVLSFCDLSRPDSCLSSILSKTKPDPKDHFSPLLPTDEGLSNLSLELQEVLNLTEPDSESYTTNPYFRGANIMSQLMLREYNQENLVEFITFLNCMTPEFRELLNKKDPGVLLLMSYWYAKAIPFQQWWTWRRASLECQAICIYLERHHSDIPHLEQILRFPKSASGLDFLTERRFRRANN